MSEEFLFKSINQIFQAIDYCHEIKYPTPELILIYSLMDGLSWIACNDERKTVRKRFREWVDMWMLNRYPLTCTSDELYSARCGIIHSLSPESMLTTKVKTIRKISYGYGNANISELEKARSLIKKDDIVALHIDDLLNSFKNGYYDYVDMLNENEDLRYLFIEKAKKHFAYIDTSTISNFIKLNNKGLQKIA